MIYTWDCIGVNISPHNKPNNINLGMIYHIKCIILLYIILYIIYLRQTRQRKLYYICSPDGEKPPRRPRATDPGHAGKDAPRLDSATGNAESLYLFIILSLYCQGITLHLIQRRTSPYNQRLQKVYKDIAKHIKARTKAHRAAQAIYCAVYMLPCCHAPGIEKLCTSP